MKKTTSETRTIRSRGDKIIDAVNVMLLVLLSFLFLAPFLHTLMASFSQPEIISVKSGMFFWPEGEKTLKGYELVFKNRDIFSGYRNTLLYMVVGTVISLVANIVTAFVVSRKQFLLRRGMMLMMTFTMFFSGGLIPFYILVRMNLNWGNTIWSMVIPGAFSVWNIIILRTSFLGIPDSLEESTMLDGGGDMTVLWHIVLPLSKAVIAVITLWTVVGYWNSWFSAMIFLSKREMYPLQLILKEILVQNDTSKMLTQSTVVDYSSVNRYKALVKYCTTIVATVPILCIYPFLQKYFVKGVMIGSIKG